MRSHQTAELPTRYTHRNPSLPAGTGMMIVTVASVFLWAMIAGFAGIVGII